MIGTTAALILAASSAASAGASVYGAKKQASTAKYAADTQTQAANHAADVQAKAAADALAFQKQQAAIDQANAEATRHANYDQWAARESRLGNTLGTMLGLGPREIPAYAPLAAPSAQAHGPLPAAPKGDWNDPKFVAEAVKQAAAITQSKNADPAYWIQKGPELVARGQQLKDDDYFWKRLLGWQAGGADVPTAGPYAGAAPSMPSAAAYGASSPSAPMTIGAYANLTRPPLTPALTMPMAAYQPAALRDYFSVNG